MDRRKKSKQGVTKSIFCLFLILVVACQNSRTPDEVAAVQQVPMKTGLSHLVFLSLQENVSLDKVKQTLAGLAEVPEVASIKVVERLDVGDKRALDSELLLIVQFASEEDLRAYDRNELHQQIRSALKPMLRLPPTTFDYQLPE